MIESTPAPLSIGARLAELAAEHPSRPSITFEDRSLTRADFHRRSNMLAHALAARGVTLGDFVTITLPNSLDFMVVVMAALKLGAVPQPVSARLPERELEAIIALARPRVVVCTQDRATRPGYVTPEMLFAESDDESDLPDRIAPAMRAPTSGGSTGRPKLIVSGTAGIVDLGSIALFRLGPDDVAVMPGPLYHNAPLSASLTAMMAGCHLVLMRKFDAEALLRVIDEHRATWLYVVPTMMHRISQLPQATLRSYDVSSLNTVWHMAAPCPPWLKQKWIEWIGAQKIWELYGGTEAQALTLINGQEWLEHRGSVGRACLGEVAIFDSEGHAVPPGVVGQVYLRRGDGSPPTYRYIGAQAESIGDWESLGDIGWLDAEGYLYLADRRTDMILVGGANVYPAEIEAALEEHPLVASSAVIGLPDEDFGNRVHAIVQTTGALDPEDLKSHLAERLVTYKLPRSIEIVSYPLRDDAGKVRRSQLREDRIAAAAPAATSA